jgi:hypothetical protein
MLSASSCQVVAPSQVWSAAPTLSSCVQRLCDQYWSLYERDYTNEAHSYTTGALWDFAIYAGRCAPLDISRNGNRVASGDRTGASRVLVRRDKMKAQDDLATRVERTISSRCGRRHDQRNIHPLAANARRRLAVV